MYRLHMDQNVPRFVCTLNILRDLFRDLLLQLYKVRKDHTDLHPRPEPSGAQGSSSAEMMIAGFSIPSEITLGSEYLLPYPGRPQPPAIGLLSSAPVFEQVQSWGGVCRAACLGVLLLFSIPWQRLPQSPQPSRVWSFLPLPSSAPSPASKWLTACWHCWNAG